MQILSIENEKDLFKSLSLVNKFLFKIRFYSKTLFKIHLFNLKVLKRINITFRQLNLILNNEDYRQFVKKKLAYKFFDGKSLKNKLHQLTDENKTASKVIIISFKSIRNDCFL